MTISEFPPIEASDGSGLLAIGGDLEVPSLLLAYRSGIFPWPFDERFPAWFAPPRRAVLFLDELHISRSLQRELRRGKFAITVDRHFDSVIRACAEVKNRGKQSGTWINKDMISAYRDLHAAGYVHSIECSFDGELAGGLYGVAINGMFAGESMFYRKPNASKIALVWLAERLRAQGMKWIDCQVLTPFLKSMGAREIARADFMTLLDQALRAKGKIF